MNPLLVFLLCTGLLNDPLSQSPDTSDFYLQEYTVEHHPTGDPTDVYHLIYAHNNYGVNDPARHVHFLRTATDQDYSADEFVDTPWQLPIETGGAYLGLKVDCYTSSGALFQKNVADLQGGGDSYALDIAGGECGPGMLIVDDDNQPTGGLGGFTQSLQLHKGWNLVSWHIEPLEPDIYMPQILPMWTTSIPPEPTWFNTKGGELYKWDDNMLYWPLPDYQTLIWNLNYAYYIRMEADHNWDEFNSKPLFPLGPVTNMLPSDAWAHDQNVGSPYASYWFFLGYAAPGYCKLASIPTMPVPPDGNPANFSFEGPFHKLIWDETAPWDWSDLKIIKDDEGRCYIPRPGQGRPAVDQIGTLEPGKGYFLGFSGTGPYTFDGWQNWPQWQNDDFTPPEPKENQSQTASAAHFQYQQYTHWSYPVYIDTVDQAQCPMAAGDEIGIFDGALCVGAAVYEGEFPLIVTAWEDDIATPLEVDGYQFNNPMTFVWYDASENTEAEFTLPPGIEALADDPVAPTHSGFGCGLYGRRSFTEGVSAANQLPQAYKLGQNYPNPFNSETIIPLELPQRSEIKIELFNIRGQNLGMIYEGEQNAGWPKVRFTALRLASGVYIYRITAQGLENGGKFQNTGKMLVLK